MGLINLGKLSMASLNPVNHTLNSNITEHAIKKESERQLLYKKRKEQYPELDETWHVAVEPVLNGAFIFERVDLVKWWHSRYTDEQFELIISEKIKTNHSSIKYLVMNPHTKKYLQAMSPHILELFKTAHFNNEGDLIPYSRNSEEPRIAETFWFGNFLRELCTKENITKSITILSLASNLCFNIDEDRLIVFRNLSEYYGEKYENPDCYQIDKRNIDFSTYKTFIKTLNMMCKKLKLSELEPYPEVVDKYLQPKRYSDDTIRCIVHSECFFDIEHVYNDIMKRGYNK